VLSESRAHMLLPMTRATTPHTVFQAIAMLITASTFDVMPLSTVPTLIAFTRWSFELAASFVTLEYLAALRSFVYAKQIHTRMISAGVFPESNETARINESSASG
jgi:hypothetical protein